VAQASRQPHPGNTGQEAGRVLAEQFKPDDRTAQQLFGRVQNLGPLEATTKPPEDRVATGIARFGDVGFQQQAEFLAMEGVIGPGTFVLSDTGHDIPMMQALMGRLDMSGALALPNFDPTVTGNGTRVADQAQTWGNEIAELDRKNAADGKVDSYFLGIDTHRNETGPVDASKLPSAEELKAAGVKKLVYLAESSPGQKGIEAVADDVEGYVRQLQEAGIEVDVRGVDYRQRPGGRPGGGRLDTGF
jgi:hypothetical protein